MLISQAAVGGLVPFSKPCQGENGSFPSILSTMDEQFHAMLRQYVDSAFWASALVLYESLVDGTTEGFLDRTRPKAVSSADGSWYFTQWLLSYVFDSIGEMRYRKRH